ncbi:MAG: TIGR02281 family clan AA aspartic protease [Proteobacteria bacterium]|nr:MAG: TIGR02281 family clan AA aspartic protease [Pseudomonadota bacterium]
MVFAAWVVFLALLAWLFQGEIEKRFNPNSDPVAGVGPGGRQEVLLQRNRAGHYVATGEVNGAPVEFLLDTGATDVALSVSTARRLGLTRGSPVSLATANGVVRGYRTILNTVSIGGILQSDVRAVITPGIGNDIVLLGMSFLKHIELVQRDGTLLLRN